MARRNRTFTTFSLSFLDIMSCGFGAVVLVFMIIDHSIKEDVLDSNQTSQMEVDLLKSRVKMENERSEALDSKTLELNSEIMRLEESIEILRLDLSNLGRLDLEEARKAPTKNDLASLNQKIIKMEITLNALERKNRALQEESPLDFAGSGGRQRLSGCKLTGKHVAILMDISASMLEQTVADVYALQNEKELIQLRAPKWRSAVKSLQWILGSFSTTTKYQTYVFNDHVKTLKKDTKDTWLEAKNQPELEAIASNIETIVPFGGTNLQEAVMSLQKMDPVPDSIWIITDGLPNQKKSSNAYERVSVSNRYKYFQAAQKEFPDLASLNVVLLPFEGDVKASYLFWKLAVEKGGCFIAPERNWGIQDISENYAYAEDAEKESLNKSWAIPNDV
ncbi:MAG: hypothetical protein P8J18_01890 [Halieaceae bacterium]|nr:hypothetical protein [Halieaceae bacterium]